MPPPSLTIAVVGADFPNDSGPTRRFAIAMCKPGDPVEMRLEPKNPADPRAVAVYSERGAKMGYLPAERCALIGSRIRQGMDIRSLFQCATPTGAAIRVSFDGTDPSLPAPASETPKPLLDETPEFWPDPEWPDDFDV